MNPSRFHISKSLYFFEINLSKYFAQLLLVNSKTECFLKVHEMSLSKIIGVLGNTISQMKHCKRFAINYNWNSFIPIPIRNGLFSREKKKINLHSVIEFVMRTPKKCSEAKRKWMARASNVIRNEKTAASTLYVNFVVIQFDMIKRKALSWIRDVYVLNSLLVDSTANHFNVDGRAHQQRYSNALAITWDLFVWYEFYCLIWFASWLIFACFVIV